MFFINIQHSEILIQLIILNIWSVSSLYTYISEFGVQ